MFQEHKMNRVTFLYMLTFVLVHELIATSVIFHPKEECQFINIDSLNELSRSFMLVWWTTCSDNIRIFKVYTRSIKILACNFMNMNQTVQKTNVTETFNTSILISDLSPFTKYEVNVTGLTIKGQEPIKRSITVTTLPENPDTLVHTPDFTSFKQAIKFFWSFNAATECINMNGKFKGFKTELRAIDHWATVRHYNNAATISPKVQQVYIDKLLPFTTYELRVYVVNNLGYDSNRFLSIKANTLPTVPQPPQVINVLNSGPHSARVNWLSQYPPSGYIEMFTIRIGTSRLNKRGQPNWLRRLELIDLSSLQCHTNRTLSNKDKNVRSFCYTFRELQASTNYLFEVRTKNFNVTRHSVFSSTKIFTTAEHVLTETSPSSPLSTTLDGRGGDIKDKNGISNYVLTIFMSFAAILILIVICTALIYRMKMHKLKLKFERQQIFALHQSSFSMTDDGGFSGNNGYLTDKTQISPVSSGMTAANYLAAAIHQIEEIQNRRLPEPPSNTDSGKVEEYLEVRQPSQCITIPVEESYDISGYIKPTFRREDRMHHTKVINNVIRKWDSNTHRGKIPLESYATHLTANKTTPTSRESLLKLMISGSGQCS